MKNISETMNEVKGELPMGDSCFEVPKDAFLSIMNDCTIKNGDIFCNLKAIAELEKHPRYDSFVAKDVYRVLKASLSEANNPSVWINVSKFGEPFRYTVQITKIVF